MQSKLGGLANRMKREWKLLENGLPKEGVYVRTYETRIDLLKVVIIGPGLKAVVLGIHWTEKTPFMYGVFVFDILVPAGIFLHIIHLQLLEYPEIPPSVYYRAYSSK